MRIVFICGSVEIGRDGVGDYTRRLAVELVNQGHEVAIVAVNDNVSLEQTEYMTVAPDHKIEVVRLPASLVWDDRIQVLDLILNDFCPDWVSLQYVPYSFHPKGIPSKFVKSLLKLPKEEYWHIMFHETWLGLSSLSPLKHKLVGFFQRKVAQRMIRVLKPERISTSNMLYQTVLEKADIKSTILPLFSNIPQVSPVADFQTKVFKQLKIEPSERNKYLILGIFGSLHQEYDFHKVITKELAKAEAMNKKLIFLSFGRMGNLEEFDRLASLFATSVKFIRLGELPEEEVSYTLQMLDLAISCTPFEHIGKSGVYAAMRLHNVKVLLPFSDPIPELENEIKQYNNYLHSRPVHKWGVEYVVSKFVKFLKNK
jgi:hypothetical protein